MANEPTGWAWFCAQSSRDVRIAAHRAGVVAQVRALELIGMTRSAAVVTVAADRKIGIATIWGWLRLVNGVGPDLRAQLVELCPRPRRRCADKKITGGADSRFRFKPSAE